MNAISPTPARRIVRWTGHPPPAEQLRNQIRSATGATYAARVFAFTGGCTHGTSTTRSVTDAARLMLFLRNAEQQGTKLPYPEDIAVEIDDGWHAETVRSALKYLAANGEIILWLGKSESNWDGECALRLPGGGTPLKTSGAPGWVKI